MRDYHDEEWGVPERDARAVWEKLMLDGFQAGLAWITVLRKREAFRKAFAGFEPAKVARFDEREVLRLLDNPGIIRSRAKIESTINRERPRARVLPSRAVSLAGAAALSQPSVALSITNR